MQKYRVEEQMAIKLKLLSIRRVSWVGTMPNRDTCTNRIDIHSLATSICTPAQINGIQYKIDSMCTWHIHPLLCQTTHQPFSNKRRGHEYELLLHLQKSTHSVKAGLVVTLIGNRSDELTTGAIKGHTHMGFY